MSETIKSVMGLAAAGLVASVLACCAGSPSSSGKAAASASDKPAATTRTADGEVPSARRKDAREQYASASPVAQRPAPLDPVALSQVRERSLELLSREVLSDSALMRANALEALHPVPTRAEAAARAGLVDPNMGVRYVAAVTIGKLKLNSSVAALRPLLADPELLVRAAAIYALSRNGEETNQTPLGSLLMDPNPRMRSSAAYLLGEMGNRSAVPMLKEAARYRSLGDATQVRLFDLQVAEALIKLGEAEAVNSLEAALYPKLAEDFEAAVLAAQIIGEVQNRRAIWQLVNLVETRATGPSGNDGGVFLYPKELRLAAATALAKMGEVDGVFVADELVSDPEQVVRSQVAFLYAATGRREYVSRVSPLLDDPSPLVRVAAAAAILKLVDGPARDGR